MQAGFTDGIDTVIIELEDDKCIAYFWSGAEDKITGDVWLFNIGETPEQIPWKLGGEPPYQNPIQYCYPHQVSLPIVETEFRVDFNSDKKKAGIYFRGYLIGVIGDQLRPGKSLFARSDSAVANDMQIDFTRPKNL
jgi:hypothetical protein